VTRKHGEIAAKKNDAILAVAETMIGLEPGAF